MRRLLKNERRTSNIERPTSNNEFCQFIKKTEQGESTHRNSIRLSSTGSGPEHIEGNSLQAEFHMSGSGFRGSGFTNIGSIFKCTILGVSIKIENDPGMLRQGNPER